MRFRSSLVFVMAALAAGCATESLAPSPDLGEARMASQAASKTSVCHVNGTGRFKLVSVAGAAVAAHLGHGDGLPGDPVPGISGTKFDDACAIVNASPDFFTFFIRNTNGSIAAPWDADIVLSENAAGDGYTFSTPMSGQKVGYGTNFFDGVPVNTLESVDWTKVSGMNGGIITYLNIWVTDNNGNYAIISSENQYPGTNFTTRTEWKVFESAGNPCNGACPALNWLFDDGSAAGRTNQYLTDDGVNTTLGALGDNIVITSPPSFASPFIGTGAPRGGYGLNLIWGDTQSNFTQPVIGQISNLTVTVAGTTYNASN